MVIQQELDHLLVARARAVKQRRPASAVLPLQLSALLREGKKTGSETKRQNHFSKTAMNPVLYLKQEVRNALIATAGGQHQGGRPFGCGRVDVHTSLQQEVYNVVVADVRGVHQRGPTSDVLAVQIHLTPETEHKWTQGGRRGRSPCTCVRCATHQREKKKRHLLFDALGHHIVLADGAGGVQVQRDVQLLGPHQGVAEPHGQAGTQLLRLTGFVAQLGHFRTLHSQGVNVTLQLNERCVR